METQIVHLEWRANDARPYQPPMVLSHIGWGLSTLRKLFARLLKMVFDDRVGGLAIPSADHLARFGHDYLNVGFESVGVTSSFLDPDEAHIPEQELIANLLALIASIASFSGNLYGVRSHKHKALVDCATHGLAEPEE